MDANSTLTIDYQPWKGGKTQVTVKFPDGSSYTDTINVGTPNNAPRFLKLLRTVVTDFNTRTNWCSPNT